MTPGTLTLALAQEWTWWGPGVARGTAPADLRPEATPAPPEALMHQWRLSGGRQRMNVQICASHARLVMLPASDELYSETRWARYAQGRIESLLGGSTSDWDLRWLVETPGSPRLLAALPRSWVATLTDSFGDRLHGLRIDAIDRLARLRASAPRFAGAMLDLGPAHALLVMLLQGRPVRVRLRRGTPDLAALCSMVTSEWAVLAARTPGLDEQLPRLAVGTARALSDEECAELARLAAQWQRIDH